jgi:hypothetical protein
LFNIFVYSLSIATAIHTFAVKVSLMLFTLFDNDTSAALRTVVVFCNC